MNNPFIVGRAVPGEGDGGMMGQGGTPKDFLAQPQAMPWNADPQPTHHISVDWQPVDATESLMREGYKHDMLGVIPQVADFDDGPGDKMPGNPGWM